VGDLETHCRRQSRCGNAGGRGSLSWLIAGFNNYLIFYRAIPEGIEVLHVYHGARDIESLFGEK
jgi:plasmid stabilization system protein ParE